MLLPHVSRLSIGLAFLVFLPLTATSNASAEQTYGCANQAQTHVAPQAQLPATATATFHGGKVRVRMVVANPTQVAQVALRANLLDWRRADALLDGEFRCTTPGAEDVIAFPAKSNVGAAIRRRGKVRLHVRFQMVNGEGAATTLRRVIVVTRAPGKSSS